MVVQMLTLVLMLEVVSAYLLATVLVLAVLCVAVLIALAAKSSRRGRFHLFLSIIGTILIAVGGLEKMGWTTRPWSLGSPAQHFNDLLFRVVWLAGFGSCSWHGPSACACAANRFPINRTTVSEPRSRWSLSHPRSLPSASDHRKSSPPPADGRIGIVSESFPLHAARWLARIYDNAALAGCPVL